MRKLKRTEDTNANDNFDELEQEISRLTLDENFDAQVVSLTIPATTTNLDVSHGLKVPPKYRIILRQQGNGVLEDGNKEWTDTTAYFTNNSANELTASVLLLRG